jgi:DNA invertase Pin-like site-specific DNA recombinase
MKKALLSGVAALLLATGLDTTTPAGKAMFQMLGVFAEFERDGTSTSSVP